MFYKRFFSKVTFLLIFVLVSNLVCPTVLAVEEEVVGTEENSVVETTIETVENVTAEEIPEGTVSETAEELLDLLEQGITPELEPDIENGAKSNTRVVNNYSTNTDKMALSLADELRNNVTTLSSGEFKANEFNGAAQYYYNFSLPVGRNGLTPQLGLSYDHLKEDNFNKAGYGWEIVGENYIETYNRYGLDKIYKRVIGNGIDYNAFLVKINGSNKKLINNIEENSQTNNKYEFNDGTYWKMLSGDGLEYEFGEKNMYYNKNGNKAYLRDEIKCLESLENRNYDNLRDDCKSYAWYLKKVKDGVGNIIEYEYTIDGNNTYLSEIKWGGNEGNNLEDFFKVKLVYEDREDKMFSYKTLFKVDYNKRLKKIEVYVEDKLTKEYVLDYSYGNNGVRSLLQKINLKTYTENNIIQERVEDEFEYYDSPVGWSTEENDITGKLSGASKIGDLNGDGLSDVVYSSYHKTTGRSYVLHDNKEVYLQNKEGEYVLDEGWEIPEYFYKYESYSPDNQPGWTKRTGDTGYVLMDINNDNKADLLGDKVYINQGNKKFAIEDKWKFFGGLFSIVEKKFLYNCPGCSILATDYYLNNRGKVYLDYNKDGRVDYISSVEQSYVPGPIIRLNTGYNFYWNQYVNPLYAPPVYVVKNGSGNYPSQDLGTRYVDINGDTLVDTVNSVETFSYINGYWKANINSKIYFNKGVDFVSSAEIESDYEIEVPIVFSRFGHDEYTYNIGMRFLDINGDGLLDYIINGNDGCVKHWKGVYFNNGIEFVKSEELQFTNVLGGFSRGSCLDTGSGSILAYSLPSFGDIDSDNLVDVYNVRIAGKYLKNKVLPYLDKLKTVKSFGGRRIEVDYKNSKQDYREEDETTLPYTYYVLDKVEVYDDSVGVTEKPLSFNTYNYYGGYLYKHDKYLNDNTNAGFKMVEITNDVGTKQRYYFHQGTGSEDMSEFGEYEDEYSKIGLVYREEVEDKNGNIKSVKWQKWGSEKEPITFSNDGYVRGYENYIWLDEELSLKYNETNNYIASGVRYEYDKPKKLLTSQTDYGQVNVTDFGKGLFVDRVEEKDTIINKITYTENIDVNKDNVFNVAKIDNFDIDNVLLSSEKVYYDNLEFGLAGGGLVTKKQVYVDTNQDYVTVFNNEYNSYGLLVRSQDGLGRENKFYYDDYNLYLKSQENALGYETVLQYDLEGKLLMQQDINNAKVYTKYDGFGRPVTIQVSDPLGSEGLVKVSDMEYYDDTLPLKIVKKVYPKTDITKYQEEVVYYNGIGKKLQESFKVGDSKYVNKYYKYNSQELLEKETRPMFGGSGFEVDFYSNVLRDRVMQEYVYDEFGRLTKTINPLGESFILYDQYSNEHSYKYGNNWYTRVIDVQGNYKDHVKDIKDNLVGVVEYLEDQPYYTKYEYNINNNLVKITDSESNVRNINYNNIGQQTSYNLLHNPNETGIGLYEFSYDVVGNITKTTDPRNIETDYVYDSLNRVTNVISKKCTEQPGNECVTEQTIFGYDEGDYAKGLLTSVDNGDVNINKEYDILGREIQTTKVIENKNYVYKYKYNLVNNVLEITYPDNTVSGYEYNLQGLPVKLSYTDVDGNTKVLSEGLEYNEVGLLTYQKNSNGLDLFKQYNRENLFRLEKQVTGKAKPENSVADYPVEKTEYVEEYEDDFSSYKSEFELVGSIGSIEGYRFITEQDINLSEKYLSITKDIYPGIYKLENVGILKDYEQELEFENSYIEIPIRVNEDGSNYHVQICSTYIVLEKRKDGYTERKVFIRFPNSLKTKLKYKTSLKVEGNNIKVKVWEFDVAEPKEWILDYTDEEENLILEGYSGVRRRNASYSVTRKEKYHNLKIYKKQTEFLKEQNSQLEEVLDSGSVVQSYSYEYDKAGNIVNIVDNVSGVEQVYEYDDLYRLTKNKSVKINNKEELKVAGEGIEKELVEVNSSEILTDYELNFDVNMVGQEKVVVPVRYNNENVGYEVVLNGSALLLNKNQNSFNREITRTEFPVNSFVGKNVEIKIEALKDSIKVKAWETGKTEPNTWHIEYEDTEDFISSGSVIMNELFKNIKLYKLEEVIYTGNEVVADIENINEISYEYSPIGNILYKSNVGTYEYGNPKFPTAVTKITKPLVGNGFKPLQMDYEYSLIGNLKEDNKRKFVWSINNVLEELEVKEKGVIKYKYDTYGNRVLSEHRENKTVFPSMDYRVLVTNEIEKELSIGGNTFVVRDEEIQTVHKDHLGSSRVLSNADGVVEKRLEYSPYGGDIPTEGYNERAEILGEKLQSLADKIDLLIEKYRELRINKEEERFISLRELFTNKVLTNPFWGNYNQSIRNPKLLLAGTPTRKYTGQVDDLVTGLYYYNARYYDSEIGRFVSVDPVVINTPMQFASDSQQMNGYAYVGNNPVMFVDPWGMDSYVFYDEEAFSDQAGVEKKRLEEEYGTDVHMYAVDTESQFIDNWNSMGSNGNDIDGVSLLFHGSDKTINIDYEEKQYLTLFENNKTPKGSSAYFIGDLNKKSIKIINLYSCNAGNTLESLNVAKTFSVTQNTTVKAMDGSVSFSRINGQSRPSSIWSQSEYFSKYNRAPLGSVQYNNGNLKDLTNNVGWENAYRWINYFLN